MIVGFIFILVSAALVALIWYLRRIQMQFSRDGVLAPGMVVGTTTYNVRLPEGGSSTGHMLVLEWRLPNGQFNRGTTPGDPSLNPVGKPVMVRYLPYDPKRVRLDGPPGGIGGMIVLGALAAMLFVFGVLMMFRR